MSSRATWHSPTRKLREGSSTATFTQVGSEGEDATSLISWVEPSLTQQRLLSIVRPRTSIYNSKAQICKQGFRCHASAASNICNASKVQCNVCTAWVLLWLTVNIRHAAKMIRPRHPNDNGFWRNTLRQVVPSASSQGLEPVQIIMPWEYPPRTKSEMILYPFSFVFTPQPQNGNNMNTTCAKNRKLTLVSLAPKHSALASTRVTTAAQLWYSGCTPKPKPKMTKSPCLGPDAQGKCKSEKPKDLCYLCFRISKTIDLSFLEMKSCCPYDFEWNCNTVS